MRANCWSLPGSLRELSEAGGDELVREVLAIFLKDTSERLMRLRSALAAQDRTEVRNQAHALKGSAGQVGAMAISLTCQLLESAAREAAGEELAGLTDQLQAQFQEIGAAMAREYSLISEC